MRTRRQFRPVFEFLPGRIAPSAAGLDVTDPMDPSSDPTSTTPMVDPIDPSSDPSTDPSSSVPVMGPGSTTPTTDPSGALLC
jgi:hypothetical protein